MTRNSQAAEVVLPVFSATTNITDDDSFSSDNDQSGDYNPGAVTAIAQAACLGITPQARRVASSIATSRKKSAREADPNKGCCFLTNQGQDLGVEACHVVPRGTSSNTVSVRIYELHG
jgi:hypothetical protein